MNAWSDEGVLLESYRYPPGTADWVPKHSHEEYQFGLGPDCPAEYHYRGASYGVPTGALSIIHPGEVHATREVGERHAPTRYRMMYVDPALLLRAAAEISGREKDPPFFPNPAVDDRVLAGRFLGLHLALEGEETSGLERDSRLLSMLTGLVLRHAEARPSPRTVGKERRAVRLAKDYLRDNVTENVSLEELSRVANLSPYHFSRVFGEEVGMPPHSYQLQARLARAKDLLLRGWPVGRAALEAGFYDQSHFTRHFERLVGVTLGVYATNSKNVQVGGA